MLLIPIGRDETVVRRTPVVSYAIIAINVAVFVLLNLVAGAAHFKGIQAKYRETVSYIQEHPYLRLPDEAAQFLPPGTAAQMEEVRDGAERSGALPPDFVVRKEQKKLDSLSAELSKLADGIPSRRFGFVPAKPSPVDRFTSLFVHADLMHLVGNMLFFFVTGPFLEDVFGKPLFAGLYLLSGIFATVCHQTAHPSSLVPLVGASGAIAGVMGAYFLRFLRSRTQFLFMPVLFLPRLSFRFFLPSYVVFPLWFLMQLFFAYNESDADSVAFAAHVGGFVVGFVASSLVRYFKIEEKYIDPKITAEISWARNSHLDAADVFRGKGELESARSEVSRCLTEEPDNPDAMAMARELALEAWDWDEWAAHSSRLLDLYMKKKETDLAVQLIQETIEEGGAHLPERFYLRAADMLVRIPEERDWGLDLYRHVGEKGSDPQNVMRALLRVARLSRESGDAAAARASLERALGHPGCSGEWKAAIEGEMTALSKVVG